MMPCCELCGEAYIKEDGTIDWDVVATLINAGTGQHFTGEELKTAHEGDGRVSAGSEWMDVHNLCTCKCHEAGSLVLH